MVGFDEYDRKARLTPGLLAVLPLALLIVSLGLKRYPAIAVASGVLVAAGGAYLLTVLVRHLGRRIEPELWASWGGPPTTSLLRATGPSGNAVLRDGWRKAVEQLTGLQLPSADEERADRIRADQTIEAAVRQILYLGQDQSYPLVTKENIQYGFERNLYGMRWVGRLVAGACVVALLLCLIAGPVELGGDRVPNGALVVGAVLDGLVLVAWCMVPSRDRTKLAADRYANQLLQAATRESRSQEAGK